MMIEGKLRAAVTRLAMVVVSSVGAGTAAFAQSSDDIAAAVEADFGQALGLFGPLPLSGTSAQVNQSGSDFAVVVAGAAYGSVPLGELSFTMSDVGEGLFTVSNVAFSDSDAYSYDSWSWTGTWDLAAQTYRELDYSASNLKIASEQADYSVDSFALSLSSAQANGEFAYAWDLSFTNLRGAEKVDDGWQFNVESFQSNSVNRGAAALDDYGMTARFLEGLAGSREVAAGFVGNPDASYLSTLPELFAQADQMFDAQLSPLIGGDATIEVKGVTASIPSVPASLDIAAVSLGSTTFSNIDDSLSLELTLSGQGLDIVRREDTAKIDDGTISVVLDRYSVADFANAAKVLLGVPEAGETWAFLADLVAFYESFSIGGNINGINLTMPDRLVALDFASLSGDLSLNGMKADGASVALAGDWNGFEITNLEENVPEGVIPEPLVFYGRVLRFDPVTTSIIPHTGKGRLEIAGLPMGQVRDTLGFQAHAAPIYDISAVAGEIVTTGLLLVTPFLLQPPIARVTETEAVGDGFSFSVQTEHQINPIILPAFGTGTTTLVVDGLDAMMALATQVEAEESAAAEPDEDLIDWVTRIRDIWLGGLKGFANPGDSDPYEFVIEATQLGEIQVNGQVVGAGAQ